MNNKKIVGDLKNRLRLTVKNPWGGYPQFSRVYISKEINKMSFTFNHKRWCVYFVPSETYLRIQLYINQTQVNVFNYPKDYLYNAKDLLENIKDTEEMLQSQ